MASLAATAYRDRLYQRMQEQRQDSPVVELEGLPGGPHVLLTRYDDCKEALSDPRLTRDPSDAIDTLRAMGVYGPDEQPDSEPHMLNADPPDHTRLRRIAVKAFTPKRTDALAPRIEQIANDLIDSFCERGTVELVSEFTFPLPAIVISELIGVPAADRDSFRYWSTSALAPEGTEGTLSTHEANERLREYFSAMLNLRRQDPEPHDDLVSALIQSADAGDQLTDREITSTLGLLLVAGHETTANLLGNSMLALATDSAKYEYLLTDPARIPTAAEEFLRFDGPIETAMMRTASEDLTVAGRSIKKGSIVHIGLASANRDEALFDSPESLHLDREPNKHLTFGHGVHYCLGARLSRLETTISLRCLLERLPDLRLTDPHAAVPYRPTGVLHGPQELPLTFTPTPRLERA